MKNIKNIFTNKITMVVLACLLLVGVFAGITIAATEVTPSLELVSVNLNHEAVPTIKYTVAIKGFATKDDAINAISLSNLSMKFWADKPADITGAAGDEANIDNGRMSNEFAWDEEKGVLLVDFYSIGFSPKRMTDTVFASAVLTDDEGKVISQTPAKSYSVFEYLCELGLSNPSADQKALIAAMEEYITYAQTYLGWTEDTAPADLVYLKVNDATFQISTDKGENYGADTYTAGTFKVGTYFLITSADNKYVRFVNQSGYICDQYGDNTYGAGSLYNSNDEVYEDRMYTAIAGTKVNVKTGDGAYVQELQLDTKDGSPAYTLKKVYNNDEYAIIVDGTAEYHKDYAFVAPLYNEAGEILVGWKDKDETVVSNDLIFFFADKIDYSEEEVTAEYYPVYGEEVADLTHDLLSGNMLLNGEDVDSVDVTQKDGVVFPVTRVPVYAEDGETIIAWTFDASARTAYLGNPAAQLKDTSATTTTLSKAHLSFNVKIDGRTATGNGTDYFVESSNPNLYQMHLMLGDKKPIMFLLRAEDSVLDNKAEYYYLAVTSDSNNSNFVSYNNSSVRMSYDKTNKIDLIVDISNDGTTYQTEMVHYYVNGAYAGSCNVNFDGNETFSNTGVAGLQATLQGRVCAKLTISDAYVLEWN